MITPWFFAPFKKNDTINSHFGRGGKGGQGMVSVKTYSVYEILSLKKGGGALNFLHPSWLCLARHCLRFISMACSQSIPPPNSNENFNYCILCKQKQSYTEMLWISFFNTTRQIAGWWKTVLLSVKESIGNLFFFHQRARKKKTNLTLKSDKIVASNFSLY